jgi:hypothetical protein
MSATQATSAPYAIPETPVSPVASGSVVLSLLVLVLLLVLVIGPPGVG